MKRNTRIDPVPGAVTAAALALVLSPATALAAPATFNTALPVSEGHIVARQQIIFAQASQGEDRIEDTTAETVVGYGATPDLALFVVLPYHDRRFEPLAGPQREVDGPGDARIMARYTVLQRDNRGRTLRVAPFAGVELPTGSDAKTDAFGPLPPELQPGSGSLDLFGGLAVTLASVDWNFDAQLAWQDNRGADLYRAGDVLQADLSVQKRLLPAKVGASTRGFLFGGIEVNYRDERRSQLDGVPVAGSAAERLFVTPVLHYSQSRWMIETALQIPVTQTGDGANVRQDHILRFGLRVNI